jgi:NAD(P)-dependent dehydrogenase (short-subunit alcohol dehydrogenase family)
MRRFDGSVVLVTGGGRGLGRAVVERFAREGATTMFCDLNREDLDEVAASLEAEGRSASGLVCDVADSAQVADMVRSILHEHGKIDVLVNNAGINRLHYLWDFPEKDWDLIMAVNLKAVFLTCRAVAPGMMERRCGRIINMSSKSGGRSGSASASAYAASKAGIMGFTRSIALELAPYNVTVNAVCPGIVFTPLWDELGEQYAAKNKVPVEELHRHYVSRIPLGREQTPESIAGVVAFLASGEAADITGESVFVTGGQ